MLAVVLAAALSAVSVVSVAVRCQDAAREAARAAARGDPGVAGRLARDVAPGAGLVLRNSDGQVLAVVRATVHPLGDWLPSFTVTERAVAAAEPTDVAGPAP